MDESNVNPEDNNEEEFTFGNQGGENDDNSPQNPLEQLLGPLIGSQGIDKLFSSMQSQGFDPQKFMSSLEGGGMAMAIPFQHLLNADKGPVNWSLAEQIAQQRAYQAGDPSLSAAQAEQVRQLLAVADLWLDPTTIFTNSDLKRQAWTRVEWIKNTLEGWKQICEPVAANAARALNQAMKEELGQNELAMPEELQGLTGVISSVMPQLSGMLFGAQVGQALAALAQESFGSADSGLPLSPAQITALVPRNVEAFSEGLSISTDEVAQFLAVRECAYNRLFAAVPWLSVDLLQTVRQYSSQIAIDPDAMAETARSIDPTDPASFNDALATGVFSLQPSEGQKRSLQRLEAMLALIEGWVEVVTAEAVTPYLPHVDQLTEMIRRRRVGGSPAEQLLKQLVGLEMRPRLSRNAARIFRQIEEELGSEGRDKLWSHPDLMPTDADLEDPESFLKTRNDASEEDSKYDDELAALLDGTLGWSEEARKHTEEASDKENTDQQDGDGE